MKFSSLKMALLPATLWVAFMCACSDDPADKGLAGSVTDIENSVAEAQIAGVVFDAAGNTVAYARVVAYYDSWVQTAPLDSVEVLTDSLGAFTAKVDSSKIDSAMNLVLFAQFENESALSSVEMDSQNKLVLGPNKSLESSVDGATSGYVRIVGTNQTAPVNEDGSFRFDSLPPGDITLSFVQDDRPRGHHEFKTDDQSEIKLPPMKDFCSESWYDESLVDESRMMPPQWSPDYHRPPPYCK